MAIDRRPKNYFQGHEPVGATAMSDEQIAKLSESELTNRRQFFEQSALWTAGAGLVTSGVTMSVLESLGVAQDKEEEEELPEPEDMTLETKDGVTLHCTYYGGLKGKKVVPIMMVHGWLGSRADYTALAATLQKRNCAVIVADLRGHGESKSYKLPNGEFKSIEAEKMRAQDIERMSLDLEAMKKFLMKKNNAGDVNIESLGIVAAGVGCIVALRWTLADWTAPRLPSYKQGQDVKALVLLSPIQTFKGVHAREAMVHPTVRSQLSVLISVGREDSKSLQEAKRVHQAFAPFHNTKAPADPEERFQKTHDFEMLEEATSLQGTELIKKELKTPLEIVTFIGWRLNAKQSDYVWSERKNPLAS